MYAPISDNGTGSKWTPGTMPIERPAQSTPDRATLPPCPDPMECHSSLLQVDPPSLDVWSITADFAALPPGSRADAHLDVDPQLLTR